MTRTQIFSKVVLLQVIKRITPPMGNEIITLIKDTCLARIISLPEINMKAQAICFEGSHMAVVLQRIFFCCSWHSDHSVQSLRKEAGLL